MNRQEIETAGMNKRKGWRLSLVATLLATIWALAGCETLHGLGMDLAKSTDKYCEQPVFDHP